MDFQNEKLYELYFREQKNIVEGANKTNNGFSEFWSFRNGFTEELALSPATDVPVLAHN